ncbi:hypothetical protein Aperf_G00000115803 [Anoplocephala perfoliata]
MKSAAQAGIVITQQDLAEAVKITIVITARSISKIVIPGCTVDIGAIRRHGRTAKITETSAIAITKIIIEEDIAKARQGLIIQTIEKTVILTAHAGIVNTQWDLMEAKSEDMIIITIAAARVMITIVLGCTGMKSIIVVIEVTDLFCKVLCVTYQFLF